MKDMLTGESFAPLGMSYPWVRQSLESQQDPKMSENQILNLEKHSYYTWTAICLLWKAQTVGHRTPHSEGHNWSHPIHVRKSCNLSFRLTTAERGRLKSWFQHYDALVSSPSKRLPAGLEKWNEYQPTISKHSMLWKVASGVSGFFKKL